MSFSRRVGIPIDRVLREGRLRGIYPEEHFMDRFRICENVIINYDIERIPKAEEDD